MNKALLASTLAMAFIFAQDARSPMRLRDVRRIFVGSVGSSEGADMVQSKIIVALSKTKRLAVVTSPDDADAVLTGAADASKIVDRGFTKDEATLAVRLIGKDKSILWAGDAMSGRFTRNGTTDVASKIVKALLKAIEEDGKR